MSLCWETGGQIFSGTSIEDLLGMVGRVSARDHHSQNLTTTTEKAAQHEAEGLRQSALADGSMSLGLAGSHARTMATCPVCEGHVSIIFDCQECDFLGCGDCYDKHSHSSDSEISAERYRSEREPSRQEEDSQTEDQRPRVIPFDRNRGNNKKPKFTIFCTRCYPGRCTCPPDAASEVGL